MARTRAGKHRFEGPLRRVGLAAQNALEIVRAGRLTAPYGAPFEVVHEDRVYKLRRYLPEETRAAGEGSPLVLVPPLMVASEVYDIAPDVSGVAALLREGVDVWLTDFGAPEREEGGLERTLDDHVRAVSDAVDRVRAATGRDVHLAGYSQGGMFVYQAAAYRRSEGLASLVTFGSPVDIHRNVPKLGDQITERLIRALHLGVALPLERVEGLPGAITSTAFKVLSARKEVAQVFDFVLKLHDRQALERRESKRMFLRGEGFVAWPGPALRTFIDEVIVANRMSIGGLVIDGRPVTLADIVCPILCFVGERDDMARPAAVRGIHRAAPRAEVFDVPVKAGHFGLVVGSTARRVTWPAVAAWLRWRDGRGPVPEILRQDEAPDPRELDEVELALDDLQFDLELFVDVAIKAAGTARHWVEDVGRNLTESVEHLRYQVPRLSRLRGLTPDSRVSLGLSLAEQARTAGEETFFLWRGRAFSYEVANRRVDHVVRGLVACGVRRGDEVAVLMSARPSYLTIVTALNRLGAVAVLISPAATDAALQQGLGHAHPTALVCDPDNAERARRLFTGEVLVLGGGGGARALPDGVVDMEAIDPDAVALPSWYQPNPGRAGDLAMIIVSAGRSGSPRAARVTNHRWAFSALGAAAAATLTNRDTVYACLPLHHAAGTMVAAGSALVSGARLALGEEFSPETFWTEVRRYGATIVFYAGEMCRQLVDAPATPSDRHHPVRLFAGSGMRVDVWRRLLERFGRAGVLEFYASTETNAVLANASGEKVGAVGRPLPGSSELALAAYNLDAGVLVRDADGRCVRAGIERPGMLLARLDEHTQRSAPDERILRDVFEPEDTWYVTGDLLRRDLDGDYWFLGRAADLVRTARGRVFPLAVEDRLYRIPGVTRAVVYGVPGDGVEELCAAVSLAPGAALDADAVEQALVGLPEQARPKVVRVTDAIPITEGFRPLREPVRAATIAGALEDAPAIALERGRYGRPRLTGS